ncbi:MAG: hypothetical protein ACLQQ4_13450 [Bacteroidia bacterium]
MKRKKKKTLPPDSPAANLSQETIWKLMEGKGNLVITCTIGIRDKVAKIKSARIVFPEKPNKKLEQ